MALLLRRHLGASVHPRKELVIYCKELRTREAVWLHGVANGEPTFVKVQLEHRFSGCIPSKPYVGFATHVKERTETAASSSYESYGLPVRALLHYHVACSFV